MEAKQTGTMVTIKITCHNPKCPKRNGEWQSQPKMPGTKIPAGNFLLSFAILLGGGSASKVFQIFSHMGLACISLNTYFKHQRVSMSHINERQVNGAGVLQRNSPINVILWTEEKGLVKNTAYYMHGFLATINLILSASIIMLYIAELSSTFSIISLHTGWENFVYHLSAVYDHLLYFHYQTSYIVWIM